MARLQWKDIDKLECHSKPIQLDWNIVIQNFGGLVLTSIICLIIIWMLHHSLEHHNLSQIPMKLIFPMMQLQQLVIWLKKNSIRSHW